MAQARAQRGNRRRMLVFGVVFACGLLIGQAWNLMRPAQYQTFTRVQVLLAAMMAASAAASSTNESGLGVQVQAIASAPLLQQLVRRLAAAGHALPAAEDDPVAALRRMIVARRVGDTEVIELRASGTTPAILAPALNELVALYRDHLLSGFDHESKRQLAGLRSELARLEKSAGERRVQLEHFRGRSGIVSTEREDAEAVARSRGLSTALNNALEKQAATEARLTALKQAAAGGATVRAKDDPTLAAQESRASQLREEVREMERSFTPEFMAMDPRARALRARLAEMERQITQQRAASQAAMLAAAQEDAAGAQAAVERLRDQLQQQRTGLRSFSTGFAQSKLLEDDLAQIERARREVLERLARLEAAERSRAPRLNVLEAAATPTQPFAPQYLRDGALAVAAAFVAGLLAMGFIELFNRPPATAAAPATTTLVLPTWPAPGPAGGAPPTLLVHGAPPTLPAGAPEPQPPALPRPMPRELQQDEAAALLAAAQGGTRLACAAGLLGLTADETVALRCSDLDRDRGALAVGGTSARRVLLPPWLADELAAGAGPADQPLLRDAAGQALDAEQLRVSVTCAAVDAGLVQPADVTPAVLRHTCIAWLIGQGLRFAELSALVGRVDIDTVSGLAGRVSQALRRRADEIEPLMPALRLAPPA
ncbi:hypothetical protein HLB44_20155 [Aquincola sp. S2]|uniref:Tyr recombinase domain-containing protein n=1 Tax=Pseudaquabacterium terrae TaxID=2732868 RepID=A0ABX2EKX1_9BURK|nr:hypothetical protein [Aquabacterium terrae]NRF69315.1 hypothetical protein [Aquabacterium terrae]